MRGAAAGYLTPEAEIRSLGSWPVQPGRLRNMSQSRDNHPPIVFGAPAPLLLRIVLGTLLGGVIGVFQLFTRATPRYVAAGAVAGALFGALIGAIPLRFSLVGWRSALAGAIGGFLAAIAWCLISGSPAIILACALGVCAGALTLRFG